MTITFPLTAGLIAAMLHVITCPDHLAAVTPFAIESKKKAWKIGLFWGIGHLVGMLSIGILFTIFKNLIPVDRIQVVFHHSGYRTFKDFYLGYVCTHLRNLFNQGIHLITELKRNIKSTNLTPIMDAILL